MLEARFLLIATYNHDNYQGLQVIEQAEMARQTAQSLFIDKANELRTYFTFIDTFEYLAVPNFLENLAENKGFVSTLEVTPEDQVKAEASDVRERMLASKPYGWIGLVPDADALGQLIAAMGWPSSPFCTVFDIQIIPLHGDSFKDTWPEVGKDVYDHQTPAMWNK